MPFAADVLFWLLVLSGLMLVFAHAAAFGLIRYRSRLTVEAATVASEKAGRTFFRDRQRYLLRVKRGILAAGVIATMAYFAGLITESLRPELAELFAIVMAGFWLPLYIDFVLLERGFGEVAKRMEELNG